MDTSEINHTSNNDSSIEIISNKLNRIKTKDFCLELKQTIQSTYKPLIAISILSVSLFTIFFFYFFDTTSKPRISIEVRQSNSIKSEFVQKNEEPLIFSKYAYLKQTRNFSENVIAFLVASFSGDVKTAYNPYPKLRERIIQLNERFNDNNKTDLIIFHTGYPFRADLIPIIEATPRQIEFVNIDHLFHKFPTGFDPHIRDPTWSQRGKWNYHHMCNFWFQQVFELKIIQRYRYMMRLDDDSQILGKWPNVFDIISKEKAIYIANFRTRDFEYTLPGITRVRNVTNDYINKNKIIVQNPAMYADIFRHAIEIPTYYNNFEVVDTSFMRRKDVIDFAQAVDESRGIFLYRWGDAPLRYITLTLFANEKQILHREKLGLNYCHPC
ncbi:unnamed protein product [Adineta steineri]|uniref:Uncharacterized protein n=1 Tax=Adineta steineri TaxID=433720 RepID=A0A814M347_9BILA|nr:unnamed protein product [Adineta steineri]CAF3890832.1 unnamed protein product [Adineta steineri]